eukprot:6192224-Pleurochrysis_carterae.AAC.1
MQLGQHRHSLVEDLEEPGARQEEQSTPARCDARVIPHLECHVGNAVAADTEEEVAARWCRVRFKAQRYQNEVPRADGVTLNKKPGSQDQSCVQRTQLSQLALLAATADGAAAGSRQCSGLCRNTRAFSRRVWGLERVSNALYGIAAALGRMPSIRHIGDEHPHFATHLRKLPPPATAQHRTCCQVHTQWVLQKLVDFVRSKSDQMRVLHN